MLTQQGGDAVGLVFLGVLLAAGAEVAAIQQTQSQGEHPFPGKSPAGKVTRNAGSPGRQLCGHFQDAVEFLLGALLLPGRVVQVLSAPGRVSADGLNVAIGLRRDPHLPPGRGNDQRLDPLHGVAVGQQFAFWTVVGKSFAAALARDPRLA